MNKKQIAKLVAVLWPIYSHLNFGEIYQVAEAAAAVADDKAQELLRAKFESLQPA